MDLFIHTASSFPSGKKYFLIFYATDQAEFQRKSIKTNHSYLYRVSLIVDSCLLSQDKKNKGKTKLDTYSFYFN
jgi:hypothetical protein